MKRVLFSLILLSSQTFFAQFPMDSASTYRIQLSAESCTVVVPYESKYTEQIDAAKSLRIITANGIPNHETGKFPNSGNPNTITPQSMSYQMPLHPTVAGSVTPGGGWTFGILFSGVELDPFTGEFFQGISGANRAWNITTLTSAVDLGLDCNNGHVQPTGKYHYHGTPNAFLESLELDHNEMIKVGYAADGFPIYYKFGLGANGETEALESGYRLKNGERPGDGKSAPNGRYDGTYFQDYEYEEGSSSLDKCNGRWGKTPESEREYYYVITDNFPSSPICFAGTPDESFHHAPPGGMDPNRGGGNRPDPKQMMQRFDRNHDGELTRSEVEGPLADHFDQLDKNGNGTLSMDELQSAGPPPQRRPR